MSTSWSLPTTFSQYVEPEAEEVHIAWDAVDDFGGLRYRDANSLHSTNALYHIARSPKHDLKNKTYFIQATGFSFNHLPLEVSGVEVRLSSNRYGRAMDDTIQLTLNGELIGENQSTSDILPLKTYGSSDNTWGTLLSIEDILNPTFGVVVRFQAHLHWPHSSPVLVNYLELRIH